MIRTLGPSPGDWPPLTSLLVSEIVDRGRFFSGTGGFIEGGPAAEAGTSPRLPPVGVPGLTWEGEGDLSPLTELLEPFWLGFWLDALVELFLISGFSGIFGLSKSSLRKLDLSRRVRSATDGGFSGRGGAVFREGGV
jgi:hypothetical protein